MLLTSSNLPQSQVKGTRADLLLRCTNPSPRKGMFPPMTRESSIIREMWLGPEGKLSILGPNFSPQE